MADPSEQSQSAAKIFGSDRMWGLKELPLPEPVSYWPATPGWYVVAGLGLIVVGFVCHCLWRRYQSNSYRRSGLTKLDEMEADIRLAGGLPKLLRGAALCAAPRANVAGLRGVEWIDWLNQSGGDDLFSVKDAAIMDRLAYEAGSETDIPGDAANRLIAAAKQWMRSHRANV